MLPYYGGVGRGSVTSAEISRPVVLRNVFGKLNANERVNIDNYLVCIARSDITCTVWRVVGRRSSVTVCGLRALGFGLRVLCGGCCRCVLSSAMSSLCYVHISIAESVYHATVLTHLLNLIYTSWL